MRNFKRFWILLLLAFSITSFYSYGLYVTINETFTSVTPTNFSTDATHNVSFTAVNDWQASSGALKHWNTSNTLRTPPCANNCGQLVFYSPVAGQSGYLTLGLNDNLEWITNSSRFYFALRIPKFPGGVSDDVSVFSFYNKNYLLEWSYTADTDTMINSDWYYYNVAIPDGIQFDNLRIQMRGISNWQQLIWLDNLSISNLYVLIYNNTLPTLSINYSQPKCINTTNQKVNWFFDINATDIDGDTIYYSMVKNNFYDRGQGFNSVFATIQAPRLGYPNCRGTYEFIDSENFYTNETVWVNFPDAYLVGFNPLRIKSYVDDFGNCIGYLRVPETTKNLVFSNDIPMKYYTDSAFRFMFPRNYSEFNLSFYSANGFNLFEFRFNQTSYGNLTLSRNGVILFDREHPNTELVYFNVQTNTSNRRVDYQLSYESIISSRLENNFTVAYMPDIKSYLFNSQLIGVISNDYFDIYDVGSEYQISAYQPVWNTTKPTNLSLEFSYTPHEITFYVTDSSNVLTADAYVEETLYINVQVCNAGTLDGSGINALTKNPNTISFFNALKGMTYNLCHSFDVAQVGSIGNVRSTEGFTWCNLLVVAYLMIMLVPAFMIFTITRDWIATLICYFVADLLGTLFLVFSDELKITILVFLGISIAVFVLRLFNTNDGGSVTPPV